MNWIATSYTHPQINLQDFLVFSFKINLKANVVMFCDESRNYTSKIFSQDASLEYVRPRKIVIYQGINYIIGIGGVSSDLYQFELIWYQYPLQTAIKRVEEQGGFVLGENSHPAETIDKLETAPDAFPADAPLADSVLAAPVSVDFQALPVAPRTACQAIPHQETARPAVTSQTAAIPHPPVPLNLASRSNTTRQILRRLAPKLNGAKVGISPQAVPGKARRPSKRQMRIHK
ncbi:hypothetical protein EV127DRAFT_465754 [Xylaria flabelliformis]|nr:hypothetical protein EV127DRAFT_465754 [Xylaria flabelliformis]